MTANITPHQHITAQLESIALEGNEAMTDKPEYPSTKRYKRRKGNGDTYASIWLSPASQAHLSGLQAIGATQEQAVAAALLLAAASPQHYGRALKALPR